MKLLILLLLTSCSSTGFIFDDRTKDNPPLTSMGQMMEKYDSEMLDSMDEMIRLNKKGVEW